MSRSFDQTLQRYANSCDNLQEALDATKLCDPSCLLSSEQFNRLVRDIKTLDIAALKRVAIEGQEAYKALERLLQAEENRRNNHFLHEKAKKKKEVQEVAKARKRKRNKLMETGIFHNDYIFYSN